MHPVTGGSPRPPGLPALRAAAADCKACDLWKRGTQTVFREGTRNAGIVLVGEQPGDKEDVAGKPFVGPAGQLLDRALRMPDDDVGRRAYADLVADLEVAARLLRGGLARAPRRSG